MFTQEPSKRSTFLAISLVILLADSLFVLVNYWQDRENLQASLLQEGKRLQTAFNIALDMTYTNMSQLATFVATDPNVRDLFARSVEAVAEEGGGAGGPQAAALRQRLYNAVAPSWRKMTEQYSVRQLHFHLGPGSTSFLRVHKPEKYGDNMDQLRHMVVDVNQQQVPKTGLELGRVYSGLRGIVPVYDNSTPPQHIGALEAGTSYRDIIQLLSKTIDADVAVLFREDRVEAATWQRPDEILRSNCGCFVEATSSMTLVDILARLQLSDYRTGPEAFSVHSELINTGNHTFALTHFGIQDYIGTRDTAVVPVGRVLIWHDAAPLVATLNHNTQANIILAIAGFILVELLLYFGINLTHRRLRQQIRKRTTEIRALNEQLTLQANSDVLTGLANRRAMMDKLDQEFAHAAREQRPLCVLMIDLDHFKQINDTFGHATGDKVLAATGRYLQNSCRNYDLAARYGGEEFCIILPDTTQQGARTVADKILQELPKAAGFTTPDGDNRAVTCSIGICENRYSKNSQRLLSLADAALYAAKQQGRNRAVVYEKKAEAAHRVQPS
ncbi:diguanylate cyclase [Pontibacterium granulatum]|uniref:sensor domain-containing diguanylate cyclase n=1 Tax=Pontibacterium granulatum TaxID=2036029 RepID=UPI00249CE34D|nr:diguanylate cyclase [Pontibacterium granulatum]MDI3324246.1 diguanylate cyclase [Pontibacterium granulatum]